MLDIKFIRRNPKAVETALRARNYSFDLKEFLALDEKRRSLLTKIEGFSSEQNKISGRIKKLVDKKDDISQLIGKSKDLKKESEGLKHEFKKIDACWKSEYLRIPNIPDSSLPRGDASKNEIIKEAGPKKKFDFSPKDHIQIAESLKIIDFKRAAKITGSNFVCFCGLGAQLVRALINFMLDLHAEKNGYTEIWPPKIVNRDAMQTTGQIPCLEKDMYRIENEDFFLIPTAEVPVTNLHAGEILDGGQLPISYVAYTPCFRKEAGSYGKETKGLMRVHEFDKIELVKITAEEESAGALEKILSDACMVLDKLELPYRILLLATGDISFASSKCYDIELYAPGLNTWLEVSSCSNFESFQARRGSIKYKDAGTGKKKFVHTLNGSGVALARLLAAIIENYQQKDESVVIPGVLRPYLNGRKRLKK